VANNKQVSPIKNGLFIVTVTAAMILGIYSLTLAFVNVQWASITTSLIMRTATPEDSAKMEVAIGSETESDLVFVVIANLGECIEDAAAASKAVQNVSETLLVSDLKTSIRYMTPDHPDFKIILEQNEIRQFPAVLIAKKSSGIVRLIDKLDEKTILDTYQRYWGDSASTTETEYSIY
jgi:hypothetical protein